MNSEHALIGSFFDELLFYPVIGGLAEQQSSSDSAVNVGISRPK